MNGRHLVLSLQHADDCELVLLACSDNHEPYDRDHHTLLAALTTCPACRAVQSARVVVIDAKTEQP